MFLAIHVPMFGTPHIDSHRIDCPVCPRGAEHGVNDWQPESIESCSPGDQFTCARCGAVVTILWGLTEPDHLSNWMNSEHCPHRLCVLKYAELKTKLEVA